MNVGSFGIFAMWSIAFGYGIGFSLDRAYNKLLRIGDAALKEALGQNNRKTAKAGSKP
jgi:hypothetical protein